MFESMKFVMAKVGRLTRAGRHVVKRFLVYGTRLRFHHLMHEDDVYCKPDVRLGMLPDFLGSEVSGEMY